MPANDMGPPAMSVIRERIEPEDDCPDYEVAVSRR